MQAARSEVLPSEGYSWSKYHPVGSPQDLSSRRRPQGRGSGLGGDGCTVRRGGCFGQGQGERQAPLGSAGERTPPWPVSVFLKSYHCHTASSQMGQALPATSQRICQGHKVPALWCKVQSRPRRLPVGQSSFPHRDGVEKTGSARDRVSATFSLRPRREGDAKGWLFLLVPWVTESHNPTTSRTCSTGIHTASRTACSLATRLTHESVLDPEKRLWEVEFILRPPPFSHHLLLLSQV